LKIQVEIDFFGDGSYIVNKNILFFKKLCSIVKYPSNQPSIPKHFDIASIFSAVQTGFLKIFSIFELMAFPLHISMAPFKALGIFEITQLLFYFEKFQKFKEGATDFISRLSHIIES
jgi:hypothetical protein